MGAAEYGARVGAAAFLLGLSLSVPHTVAVASADDAVSPSGVASDEDARAQGTTRATARGAGVSRPSTSSRPGIGPSAAQRAETPSAPPTAAQRPRRGDGTAAAALPRNLPKRSVAATSTDRASDLSAPQPSQVEASPQSVSSAAAPVERIASAGPATPARVAAAQVGIATAGIPTGKAISSAALTDAGPLGQIQSFLEGIGLLIRRTLFNQAPTVSPIQTSGQVVGPITGTIGAEDPEGDPLSYSVTTSPQSGSVSVSSDGTYTYTPGSGFTGLDGFTVAVTDGGFHINLLDLFRPTSTGAYTQVAQNPNGSALTFSFAYVDGGWASRGSAKAQLEAAAMMLASYLAVNTPVTLTYRVGTQATGDTLAQAGSDLTSDRSGFFKTITQTKIQTGFDPNGANGYDGTIDWNFSQSWGYGSVTSRQYDFTSTAMHELLHTFGYISYIGVYAPTDEYADLDVLTNRNWTQFDSFIVNSSGTSVINGDSTWNTNAMSRNALASGGDLFFNGPTAVRIYGGKVPLFTPDSFSNGSSVSHLDDDVFGYAELMTAQLTTGPSTRQLSRLDLAILQDLGYTLTNPLFVVVGFGFIRRRRENR